MYYVCIAILIIKQEKKIPRKIILLKYEKKKKNLI